MAKDNKKKNKKGKKKGVLAAVSSSKAGKRIKAMTGNAPIGDVVAAALVATAAALKDSNKARRLAASAGDELTALSKKGAEQGNAMWQLALDIGQRAMDSLLGDEKPKGARAAKRTAPGKAATSRRKTATPRKAAATAKKPATARRAATARKAATPGKAATARKGAPRKATTARKAAAPKKAAAAPKRTSRPASRTARKPAARKPN